MPIRWTAALLSLLLVVAATGADRGRPAASAASAAQWTSGGPYADDATAVAASPGFDADGIAFMGTSQQIEAHQPDVQGVAAILRSTDGGLTWTTAYSRASTPGTNKEWLTQIVASPAFATDRTVFATWSERQSGGVLRSTDGGATWTGPAGPTGTLGHDQLAGASSPTGQQYDFSFAGPSTVYAVHDWAKAQPRIYRSTDAGAT